MDVWDRCPVGADSENSRDRVGCGPTGGSSCGAVDVCVSAGRVYWLRLTANQPVRNVTLHATLDTHRFPAGERCDAATNPELAEGANAFVLGTRSDGACGTPANDVWFGITAPGRVLRLHTGAGTAFDSALALYDASDAAQGCAERPRGGFYGLSHRYSRRCWPRTTTRAPTSAEP